MWPLVVPSCGQSGQLPISQTLNAPCHRTRVMVALISLEGVCLLLTLIPQGSFFNLLLVFSVRVGSFLECLMILVCKYKVLKSWLNSRELCVCVCVCVCLSVYLSVCLSVWGRLCGRVMGRGPTISLGAWLQLWWCIGLFSSQGGISNPGIPNL